MAIARCDKHTPDGTRHSGIKHAYKTFALPLGYPETAAICGREDCEGPARLWLTELECADHQRGVRIFRIRTNAAKIRVSVELIQTETLPTCT
jgi:hypothetical protein